MNHSEFITISKSPDRWSSISVLHTLFSLVCAAILLTSSPLFAEESTKADPKHYTVEFENEHVRVIRAKYGAGEKSVMHDHARYVVVSITDASIRFTTPDGKTEEHRYNAGDVAWSDAEAHLPENTGNTPTEAILIEIK